MKRNICWIVLLLVLAGCSSPPPIPYEAPTLSFTLNLPDYADESVKNSELQDALVQRGLVLDRFGRIVPLDEGSCLYPIATRTALLKELEQYQSSSFGYTLVSLKKQGDDYFFFPNDSRSQTLESLTLSFDSVLFDLTSIDKGTLVRDWTTHFAYLDQTLLVTGEQHKLLKKKHLSFALRNILIVTGQRASTVGELSMQFVDAIDTTRFLVLTHGDVLRSCQALTQGTMISTPTEPYSRESIKSQVKLVSLLPADADFNQLKQQQSLLSTGRYLTYRGDIATLIDRCSAGQGQSNQALCHSKADDSSARKKKVIVFGGKHGA
ncbi:hypothetical protein ACOMICROBIO_GDFFDHBD_03501 [Vibrio sp. B1REV9]|uniref:hypothetical protein n=1 Tax=Vibrio sp. B1REV9 TaxID=2751179 RepID=UPI001B2EFE40|nr:hypothetical protein [Vibrio sp. B1REV9]CAE6948713.1 hypothetical protein ACOMICROBIO_GDFFDHBD_03501 [Vibrio sp. B1REV9]